MSVRLISVEGNIGSGKSTFLEHLRQKYANHENIVFAPEPVSVWQSIRDENGTSILEKFYQDQATYAFAFQMMAYISRLAVLRKLVRDRDPSRPLFIITERSLHTDKHIFAKMLYDQRKIDDINYQIYLKWFHEFADDIPVTDCVYLQCSPEVCYNRIALRARPGEEAIPLNYLQECNRYHEDYVQIYADRVVMDANTNIMDRPEALLAWMDQFDQLLQK
jgi:deoxyadenosine/deoxycytidine kinase